MSLTRSNVSVNPAVCLDNDVANAAELEREREHEREHRSSSNACRAGFHRIARRAKRRRMAPPPASGSLPSASQGAAAESLSARAVGDDDVGRHVAVPAASPSAAAALKVPGVSGGRGEGRAVGESGCSSWRTGRRWVKCLRAP